DLGLERFELVFGHAELGEARARAVERIAPLPLLDLFLRAVEARVAHRVAEEAIRDDLDQRRLARGAGALDGLGDAALDIDDVIAVEAIARHAMRERAQ